MSRSSLISKFYQRSIKERLQLLVERELLTEDDRQTLLDAGHVLDAKAADQLVENVIGVFALPLGLGLNFLVNDKEYVVPMVVEEPSIIAAVSAAAKLMRQSGGFRVTSDEPMLIGQIQVVDAPDLAAAEAAVALRSQELIDLANSLHPRMVARGGGAKRVELRTQASDAGNMLIVHLIVDTRDAMGANLINSMCEGIAPLVEQLTGGQVFLRILSNLTDLSMVRARASIPVSALAGKGYTGEQVRDGVVLAGHFAAVDPYRAATHNKGIMNGIDPVALATGNDWRAVESAAHAYAGLGPSYTSLTRWSRGDDDSLVGEIEIPIKVGTVGGPVQSNPAVRICHRLMGIESARELAELMGCVGLAQNFAALRALSTEGIQRGHMALHARTCAAAGGATAEILDQVVEQLIADGEIKVWKAKQIVERLRTETADGESEGREDKVPAEPMQSAHGRVVLLGGPAIGRDAHSIVAPIPLEVKATARAEETGGIRLVIPSWSVDETLGPEDQTPSQSIRESLDLIARELGVRDQHMTVEVYPDIPRASGLGGSEAMASAVIRAIAATFSKKLSPTEIGDIAFRCEAIASGTDIEHADLPVTLESTVLVKPSTPPELEPLLLPAPISLVIGFTGVESLSAGGMAALAAMREQSPELYGPIFALIDELALKGAEQMREHDLNGLGQTMNVCHGMLNTLGVSTPKIEHLVHIAREAGALGAKLTGAGGGGAIVALCPDDQGRVGDHIVRKMKDASFRALQVKLP